MRIGGLMKLTLLDFPDKVACTVFLRGCDFACPFCHNSLLLERGEAEDGIDEDELMSFLKKRQGVLDGVCISGGEPLMSHGVEALAAKIKEMGYLLKLDTNGSYPQRLAELLSKGLVDYVAMDVKSSPEGYAAACGREIDIEKIKESIRLLKGCGVKHEFRTTAVKGIHKISDIEGAAALVGEGEAYFLQNYKKSDAVLAPCGLESFSEKEMEELLCGAKRYNSKARIRGE